MFLPEISAATSTSVKENNPNYILTTNITPTLTVNLHLTVTLLAVVHISGGGLSCFCLSVSQVDTLANTHDITDPLYWPVMFGHNSWYFIDGISLASDHWTLLMISLSSPCSPILTSILDHDWNRDVRYGPTSRMRIWPSKTSDRTKSSTSQTRFWLMTRMYTCPVANRSC